MPKGLKHTKWCIRLNQKINSVQKLTSTIMSIKVKPSKKEALMDIQLPQIKHISAGLNIPRLSNNHT